jgi:uncharacterized RDD family membrane protein YckC
MKIKCPACSKVLAIPDSAAGKVVKCPCGKQLRAPGGGGVTGGATAARPPAGAAPRSGTAGGKPVTASRPPQPSAGDLDADIFDELTDQDLKPVKGVSNPYKPTSAPAPGGGKLLAQYAPSDVRGGSSREIAGVGSRILGALIDGLFLNGFAAVGAGIALAILLSAGDQEPSPVAVFTAIAIIVIAVLIPLVINCILISKSGQSVGKKLVKTRMIDQETGVPVGFVQGFLVRSFVFGLLTQIPLFGAFIAIADIIYLFTENHQTLHDKLAKTLVVRA